MKKTIHKQKKFGISYCKRSWAEVGYMRSRGWVGVTCKQCLKHLPNATTVSEGKVKE